MTIEKGEAWGRVVPLPTDLRVVAEDAAVAAALSDGTGRPVAPGGGDLHRTLGGRDIAGRDEALELPIDLLRVTVDGEHVYTACAHVVVQQPLIRGGWWRGDVLMVMNAEFLGNWQVAARGHPNDGRAESCSWGSDLAIRQRFEARRRLPTGGHVPHPQIETRSFRQREWTFSRPMVVTVDGRRVARATALGVEVIADAAVIYA